MDAAKRYLTAGYVQLVIKLIIAYVERKKMKVILKNNDNVSAPSKEGVINLPSIIWKSLGWKINEPLHIEVQKYTEDDPGVVIILPRSQND